MEKEKIGMKQARLWRGIAAGALTASVLMLGLCFAGALLLSKQMLPERAGIYLSWTICVVGAFAGCAFAQKKAGGARLPVSLGCGAVLCLIMLGARLLMKADAPIGWFGPGLVMAASVLTALLGAGRKRRR